MAAIAVRKKVVSIGHFPLRFFFQSHLAEMNANPPAGSALSPGGATGPTTPKKGPPKFKQRQARTFKSKAPKPGQKG